MTTTVAGLIIFLLGLGIEVVGIVYHPGGGSEAAPANQGVWDRIVEALIRWVDELFRGRNPKRQLLILGVLVMIAGVAVLIIPQLHK